MQRLTSTLGVKISASKRAQVHPCLQNPHDSQSDNSGARRTIFVLLFICRLGTGFAACANGGGREESSSTIKRNDLTSERVHLLGSHARSVRGGTRTVSSKSSLLNKAHAVGMPTHGGCREAVRPPVCVVTPLAGRPAGQCWARTGWAGTSRALSMLGRTFPPPPTTARQTGAGSLGGGQRRGSLASAAEVDHPVGSDAAAHKEDNAPAALCLRVADSLRRWHVHARGQHEATNPTSGAPTRGIGRVRSRTEQVRFHLVSDPAVVCCHLSSNKTTKSESPPGRWPASQRAQRAELRCRLAPAAPSRGRPTGSAQFPSWCLPTRSPKGVREEGAGRGRERRG